MGSSMTTPRVFACFILAGVVAGGASCSSPTEQLPAAVSLVVSGLPSLVTAGVAVIGTVTAKDASGNPVTGYSKLRWAIVTVMTVFTVACRSTAPNCAPPPPSNLVSWWPGEGAANDIVGANNGTVQGGATFATGEVGRVRVIKTESC